MSARTQVACAACGPVFLVLWVAGFAVIAGFLPPPSPNLNAVQLAHYFGNNRTGIRLGIIVAMVGTGLMAPWLGALCVLMKQIEGRRSPLTYTNLTLSSMLMVAAFLPLWFIQVIVYRAHRPVGDVLLLSDMTWLPFVGFTGCALVQWTCIGAAILKDKHPKPVMPRWSGYLCLSIVVCSLPAFAIYFVKSGPLAWNGLLSFWIPLATYGIWVIGMTAVMIPASRRSDAEPTPAAAQLRTEIEAAVRRALQRPPAMSPSGPTS
jgi:hypothetical protein